MPIEDPHSLSPGESIPGESGTYTVDERIGVGGTSLVYRVRDADGQAYAAKVLSSHRFTIDDAMRRRFMREIALLRSISDPHVVGYVDTGTRANQPFLVMELAKSTVHALLRRHSRLTTPTALAIILSAVRGAAAIHRAGMVHRDLTPRNLLLMHDGRAVIGDFGTVRNLTDGTMTHEGDPLGSLIYISSQHFDNPHTATPSDDVFQLGQVAYELLSGNRPVGNPPALPSYGHGDEYVGVVDKMRNHDRGARFADAEEALAQLCCVVDARMVVNADVGVEHADQLVTVISSRQLERLASGSWEASKEVRSILTNLVKLVGALHLRAASVATMSAADRTRIVTTSLVEGRTGAMSLLTSGSLVLEHYVEGDSHEIWDEAGVTNRTTGAIVSVAAYPRWVVDQRWGDIHLAMEFALDRRADALRAILSPFDDEAWLVGHACTDCGTALRLLSDPTSGAVQRYALCAIEPPTRRSRCAVCGVRRGSRTLILGNRTNYRVRLPRTCIHRPPRRDPFRHLPTTCRSRHPCGVLPLRSTTRQARPPDALSTAPRSDLVKRHISFDDATTAVEGVSIDCPARRVPQRTERPVVNWMIGGEPLHKSLAHRAEQIATEFGNARAFTPPQGAGWPASRALYVRRAVTQRQLAVRLRRGRSASHERVGLVRVPEPPPSGCRPAHERVIGVKPPHGAPVGQRSPLPTICPSCDQDADRAAAVQRG